MLLRIKAVRKLGKSIQSISHMHNTVPLIIHVGYTRNTRSHYGYSANYTSFLFLYHELNDLKRYLRSPLCVVRNAIYSIV